MINIIRNFPTVLNNYFTHLFYRSNKDYIEFNKPSTGQVLLIYQTKQQKYLLERYGETTLIDATYKTLIVDLPLFFLAVRTNVCYMSTAAFVLKSENSSGILEALQVIKTNVDKWNPKHWLTDYSEPQIRAISSAFPGNICSFIANI